MFAFVAGSPAINFVKQYAASGLKKDIPLYSAFTVYGPYLETTSATPLSAARSAAFWTPDIDNPASKHFVEAFRKEYGYVPSNISAQAYESARIIDAAVTPGEGQGRGPRRVRHGARCSAKFDSIRGPFRYGKNHFPVQSFHRHARSRACPTAS